MNEARLRMARDAAARGVSLVCATCEHFAAARAADLPDDSCGRPLCGGPFAGREFPDYVGPITDFARWCIACGEPAVKAVRVPGGSRPCGLCGSHVALASTLFPASGPPPILELVSASVVPVQSIVRSAKPRPRRGQSFGEILADLRREGLG